MGLDSCSNFEHNIEIALYFEILNAYATDEKGTNMEIFRARCDRDCPWAVIDMHAA